ncbi:MAG: adenylate kinase [Candidatus Izemoplasmatales bacterium]|uniref:adenylate kinase n=1 Tax=Hujiaoplasma nucleasis TaxID=2725268 RepID=UPI00289E1CCB|nr:adenylate kinase [Hujiaoplasma nucleasis]
MINLLIMGKPGAGKGTQAKKILDHFSLTHISTGDIYRDEIKKGSEIGQEAKKYLDQGNLVPDKMTNDIVWEVLQKHEYPNGFMLDGFPRTIAQAEALDEMLNTLNIHLTAVINVDVDDDVISDRMAGRRVCSNCGETYHVEYHPPKKDGVCDVCGHSLIQRKDDLKESVLNRLQIYKNKTQPLLDYYENKDLLLVIDGENPSDQVFEDILIKLGELHD